MRRSPALYRCASSAGQAGHPGNHDIPLFNLLVRLAYPYANYRRAFGPELAPRFCSDDLLVIGVDTTRPWRHKDGEVSAAQIDFVARRLRSAIPRQLRVVAVHQPVAVIRDSDRANLRRGHRHAAERWADLILSGHIHFPYVKMLHDRQSAFRRPVWAVSAGTAISRRVREDGPNSVNLIRYDPTQAARACIVERRDFDAVSDKFVIAQAARLELKHGTR